MFIDPPQTGHSQAAAKFMQDAHPGHLGLAPQPCEFSPRALLGQELDQQIDRMHRREQTQQMDPIKLGRAEIAPPPARVVLWPCLVDEIVGHQRAQKFKQSRRAGCRKVGIHVPSLPPNI